MKQCCCGAHIGLGETLHSTVCSMDKGKSDAIQVFYGGTMNYNIRKFSADDIRASGDYLRAKSKKLYVHAPYVINLASTEKSDNSDKLKAECGQESLQNILNVQASIDPENTGTVLHIGAKGTVENVIDRINSIDIKSPLLLENSAGEGSKLGKDIDQLRKLKEGIDSHRVGFCLDTCHCHSSGMCDMREHEKVVQMFDDVHGFGCKRLMVHLNDSETEMNSKKDRHAVVGFGSIWNYHHGPSFESLVTLRDICRENYYDTIIETPSSNIETFELRILKP
jgi:deoxyribonuclease-4